MQDHLFVIQSSKNIIMFINNLIFSMCISSVISCQSRGLPPDFNATYPWIGPRLKVRLSPTSIFYGKPIKAYLDTPPDAPLLFPTPILWNAECNLQGADSCDLVKINFNVLGKQDTILFIDGYIWHSFIRHKTYQVKNNILSIYKVLEYQCVNKYLDKVPF